MADKKGNGTRSPVLNQGYFRIAVNSQFILCGQDNYVMWSLRERQLHRVLAMEFFRPEVAASSKQRL